MKKIISLMMAILFVLLSCALLCSCDKINPLELEGYSQISEEDKPIIQCVTSRYDYRLVEYDKVPAPTFIDKIKDVQTEGLSSFYKASIDNDSRYYICGYGSTELSSFMYMTIGDGAWVYEWYRVDGFENIQKNINNKELVHLFVVYDAVVEKDLIDGTSYNLKTKYYSKRSDMDREFVIQGDTFIIYRRKYLINEKNYPYLTGSDLNDGYRMYIDDNGVEYLAFLYEQCREKDGLTQNCSERLFLDYYDVLSPYFVLIDEFETISYYNEDRIINKYAGIEVEKLVDLLIEK